MKYLIGAGGHASVIYDIAKKQNIDIDGVFIDDDKKNITGLPVIGTISDVSLYYNDEFILAFGDIQARIKLEKILSDKVNWFSLIDKDAIISDNVDIGIGTVVMPGAIINSGSVIGNHAIINSGSIIEHGCYIGNHVHVSPGSVLCGNVIVGDASWVCAGTTVINNVSIGSNSIIGAGSLVINDIPDNCLSFGSPAKVKKISRK